MTIYSYKDLHQFLVRINGNWYKDSTIYSDREFHMLMTLYYSALPHNLSVHHFRVGESSNPVIEAMPEITIPVYELTQHRYTQVAPGLKVYYQGGRKAGIPIHKRYYDFVLASSEEFPMGLLAYVDGKEYSFLCQYHARPVKFQFAKEYVAYNHRHNKAPVGHKFSVALNDVTNCTIGVLIASVPKARHQNNGTTLELNRCCVDERYHNVCSALMGRAIRIGKEMGYTRFLTYTRPEESGSSLKAAGFVFTGMVKAKKAGWNSNVRVREIVEDDCDKLRWELKKAA